MAKDEFDEFAGIDLSEKSKALWRNMRQRTAEYLKNNPGAVPREMFVANKSKPRNPLWSLRRRNPWDKANP